MEYLNKSSPLLSKMLAKTPDLTVWGTHDTISWRDNQNPLLFYSNYTQKEAHTAVMQIVGA